VATVRTVAHELEKNRHQGHYGEAFVASIVAATGFDLLLPRLGDVMDMQVYSRGPRGTSGSHQIAIQVKSWSVGELSDDGYFHYPLEVPAFNNLAGPNDVRHYLALCIVPPEISDYSDAQHARLSLNYAAYWLSLRDKEPDASLNPDSTKVVYVPRTNLITATTIRALVYNQEHLAVVP
jgi:Domain of unknown function (DUF4365)